MISRRQALAAGLTDAAIEARLRSARWRRLYSGVYATFSGPVPRPARRWAALLYAGPGSLLSHYTAADLVGLADPESPDHPVHVTIPTQRRVRSVPGVVVVHRSHRTAVSAHPSRRPPQTRVEETVLDLTQLARTVDQAIGWAIRACGARLTTPARLAAALAARRKLRWRADLASAIADAGSGCHSLLELRWLRRVERPHGLPPGRRQRPRARAGGRWYDDVHYQPYRTLVELDGRVAHPDRARWRDLRRDNAGVADGLSVLRYGAGDVAERPCEAAAQVATVLIRNGWSGSPTPCGPGCPASLMITETRPASSRDRLP